MERQEPAVERVFSGAPWESQVGYCRAIRMGNIVAVTGTAPVAENGEVFAPGDAYAQTRKCLEIIERALKQLGVGKMHIIRTRLFVTEIARWREFGKAHKEFFAAHPPATSMIEIKSLIDPQMLIEIEADAVFTPPPAPAYPSSF